MLCCVGLDALSSPSAQVLCEVLAGPSRTAESSDAVQEASVPGLPPAWLIPLWCQAIFEAPPRCDDSMVWGYRTFVFFCAERRSRISVEVQEVTAIIVY